MAAGRPRKPTMLKIVQGTARQDRLNQNEPVVVGDVSVTAPDYLTPDQAEEWEWFVKNCPPGMVKKLDSDTLANYVVAKCFWKQAVEGVRVFGMVITSPSGFPMPSPYSSEVKKYSVIMLRLASELGFTPASRSKISIDPEKKADDPWAAMASGM